MKDKKTYKSIIGMVVAMQMLLVNVALADGLDGLSENPNTNIILLAILSVLIIILMLYVRKIGLEKQRLQKEAKDKAQLEAQAQDNLETEQLKIDDIISEDSEEV